MLVEELDLKTKTFQNIFTIHHGRILAVCWHNQYTIMNWVSRSFTERSIDEMRRDMTFMSYKLSNKTI